MDEYDRERHKHEARESAHNMYDEHYGGRGDQYDPNSMDAPDRINNRYGSNY